MELGIDRLRFAKKEEDKKTSAGFFESKRGKDTSKNSDRSERKNTRSEVFIEYQDSKLKSSLRNFITSPKVNHEIPYQPTVNSAKGHSHKTSKLSDDLESNLHFDNHTGTRSNGYKINIFKPDFGEMLKGNGSSFFPGKNVSLKSNNMIFNMSNNFLVDSKGPAPSRPKSRLSIDSHSDVQRASQNSDLKERITATKKLFTPTKSRCSFASDARPEVQFFVSKRREKEILKTEEASDNEAETSRSVIFINEKIKQLLPTMTPQHK